MTTVALVRTRPESVLDDVSDAMRRAGYREHLDPAAETALKINISWQHWYPACSTAPWQLDGVTRTLLADGFAPDSRTVVVDARVGERANARPVLAAHGVANVHLYEDERWVRYEPRGRLSSGAHNRTRWSWTPAWASAPTSTGRCSRRTACATCISTTTNAGCAMSPADRGLLTLRWHDVPAAAKSFPEGVLLHPRTPHRHQRHPPAHHEDRTSFPALTTITGAMKNAFGGLLFEN